MGIQRYGDVQTYRGHPNIWSTQTYGEYPNNGASKHMGHPNIQVGIQTYRDIQTWGVSKHTGSIQHMGASKCMEAYGHPLILTKHAFIVLCMYRGHLNIIKTYRASKDMGVSKHTGIIPACLPILQNRLCH